MRNLLICLLLPFSIYAQEVELFAHRGFRGLAPENTITAFKNALHKTQTLEMDIMLSKDLEVIVTHDPKIHSKLYLNAQGKELTKKEEVALYDLNYNQIESFIIGLKKSENFPKQITQKERIPTLERVFKEMKLYALQHNLHQPNYFIETKIAEKTDGIFHPDPKVVVEALVKVLKQNIKPEQVIIQSFDPRTLSYIEKNFPEYRTCLLDGKKQPLSNYLTELDFIPDYFSPSFPQINGQTLQESKTFGVKLIGGNSNSKKNIDQMKAWGINQIISDYPYEELPNE